MISGKKLRCPVRLLIAGCGDLGARVGRSMLAQGWQVYALRRDPSSLPAEFVSIAADLACEERPIDWPDAEIDYVLYAAAADRRDEQAYRQAYVLGLTHLLAWLKTNRQRPRHIVFVSSTAVYGQSDGSWVDEDSITEPKGFNGRVLLQAQEVLAASGLAATTVRLAGLYGAQRRALIDRVARGYQVPRAPVHFSNRIHIEDAASLLCHLLHCSQQGIRLQECYVGVDDQPVALDQLIDWLRAALAVQVSMPAEVVRGVGSKRCSNARARALGWQPRYPSFIEGYQELLQRFIQ